MDTVPQSPQRRNYFGDASMWWHNWVPVAATGWGALVVIAPLLAADYLIWAIRGPVSANHSPDLPEFDDPA